MSIILRNNKEVTSLKVNGLPKGSLAGNPLGINDIAGAWIIDILKHNSTLTSLDISHNKLGRPSLTHFAKCLTDNTGLISVDLTGHRINSEVAIAFVEAFKTNMTLIKLIWKLEVSGYNLRFTEILNRNTEIDRLVREASDYTALLPKDLQGEPPKLLRRPSLPAAPAAFSIASVR